MTPPVYVVQTNVLLAEIVEATGDAVRCAYPEKVAQLDKSRARLQEKASQSLPPRSRMDGLFEQAITFLASPWKMWETGQTALLRAVLKLAVAERPQYHRETGYRMPKITLPFKALGGFGQVKEDMVRPRRLELPRVLPHSDLNAARLPIPPRPHAMDRAQRLAALFEDVKRKLIMPGQETSLIKPVPHFSASGSCISASGP